MERAQEVSGGHRFIGRGVGKAAGCFAFPNPDITAPSSLAASPFALCLAVLASANAEVQKDPRRLEPISQHSPNLPRF